MKQYQMHIGGMGRESGLEAIKEYLQVKSVWISSKPSAGNPFVIR